MTRALPVLALLVACGGKQTTDTADAAIDCSAVALDIPSGRGELQGAWDDAGKRLVLFGGNQAVPVNCSPGATDFVGQTWTWNDACDGFVKLDVGDAPKARGRFAAALDAARGRMIVHGGRFRDGDSGDYTLYSDVWAFDFATDTWSKLSGASGGPSKRFDHGGAVIGDTFYVFGGNESESGANIFPTNDTWAFDLVSNTWSEVGTSGDKPAPRVYHSVTTDGSKLYVYAGGDENALFGSGFLDDTWAYSPASDSWSEVNAGGGDAPLERIWPNIAWDETSGRIVLFGGHDGGDLGNNNEVWSLNPSNGNWQRMKKGDTYLTPANAVCDFPADFTKIDPDSPERRSAATLVNARPGELLLFGGKTDCGNANDVWSLDVASETWTVRSRATEGEVCLRAYAECESMCF